MHAQRHPFFEAVVFGTFGLLTLVLVVLGARRLFAPHAAERPTSTSVGRSISEYYGQDVPEGGNLVRSSSERAVSAVAPAAVSFGAPERKASEPSVPRP